MKITGLEVHLFEPRPNHHQETPEYVHAPTRQNGVAVVSTDEGITGVVSSDGAKLKQLAGLWPVARDHIEGQDPFDRGQDREPVETPLPVAQCGDRGARLRPVGHRGQGAGRAGIQVAGSDPREGAGLRGRRSITPPTSNSWRRRYGPGIWA